MFNKASATGLISNINRKNSKAEEMLVNIVTNWKNKQNIPVNVEEHKSAVKALGNFLKTSFSNVKKVTDEAITINIMKKEEIHKSQISQVSSSSSAPSILSTTNATASATTSSTNCKLNVNNIISTTNETKHKVVICKKALATKLMNTTNKNTISSTASESNEKTCNHAEEICIPCSVVLEYGCFANTTSAECFDKRNRRSCKRLSLSAAELSSQTNSFLRNTNIDYYSEKFAAFYSKNCVSVVMAKDPIKVIAYIMSLSNYDPTATCTSKQLKIKNVVTLAEYCGRENGIVDLQLKRSRINNYTALSDPEKKNYELNPFTVCF